MTLNFDTPFKSPLNLAHLHHKKAEKCMRLFDDDGAITHHAKAAEYLKEAMKICKCANAINSLSLQYDSHIKAENFIKQMRKEQTCIKEKLENKREAIMDETSTEQPRTSYKKTEELQLAIYDVFDTQDSLLQFHFQNSAQPVTQESKGETSSNAVKTPKKDEVIIEELRMNNGELKKMVTSLIVELELYKKENMQLREKLRNQKTNA